MKNALLLSLIAGTFAGGAFAAYADEPFDNRFYVAPMGSITGNRNTNTWEDGYGGGLAVGAVLFPHVGVEVLGDYLHYDKKSKNAVGREEIYGGGGALNLYASSTSAEGVFFHADAQGGNQFVYNLGLGFDQPLFNRRIYVRIEALSHKESDFSAGPMFKLGVRVPLGSVHEAPAAPPEPPVEVVPVEQPPAEAPPPPPPPPPPCTPPAAGQPVSFEGCKTGDTIVLRGVNFEFNKARLMVDAKTLLDQVADALQARPDIKVEVDGHTDGKGSASYNQKLSEARAASVKQYLIGRGITADRLSSKGFGKTMPIADNATDEGREQNRRVELKVLGSEGAASPPSEGQSAPAAETPPADAGVSKPASKKKRAKKRVKTEPVSEAPAESSGSPDAAPAPSTPESSAPSPAAPDESSNTAQPASPPPAEAPASAPASGNDAAPTEPAQAPPDPASAQADKPH